MHLVGMVATPSIIGVFQLSAKGQALLVECGCIRCVRDMTYLVQMLCPDC